MEKDKLLNSEENITKIKPFTMEESEDKRLSRASNARRTRTEDERPPIVFGSGSRFNLPAKILKKLEDDGKVLGFVVYSSGNVEQKENYFNAVEREWQPLDARQYPELLRQYELSPFGVKEEDHLIRRGGQIAMIRDKDIDAAERDYYDSEKSRQEYMSSMYKQTDPRLPKPFLDERTRQRGR